MRILSIFLCLSIATSAWALEPVCYNYKHVLEMNVNYTSKLTDYSQRSATNPTGLIDGGIVRFSKGVDGINFGLRYTQYVSRHWGFFVQEKMFDSNDWASLAEDRLKGCTSIDYMSDQDKYYAKGIGEQSYQAIVGASYRYDFLNRFSLRPRVGAGLMLWRGDRYSIYNHVVTVPVVNQYSGDYLVIETTDASGNSLKKYVPCFAYAASLQLTCALSRHFFLAAEAGISGTTKRVYQTDFHIEYYSLPGTDITMKKVDSNTNKAKIGTNFELGIGVGWNF